ncbi:Uma2 family endonuclease [candidate division KSB1 bacterium]|nr:Uma2 family endonuclease [candidate division KSB1 bacterium]
MQKPNKSYYTMDEYFAFEQSSEIRHEFYKGEIFAMSGASINHNRINSNLSAKLNASLFNRTCEAFANDMRVWVKEKDLFTYPDILVICETPQFFPQRNDTITNPLIIMEVLSESTRNYDRGDKFMFYRSIQSFKEYVLVDQYAIHVEHFFKNDDGKWVLSEYNSIDDQLILTHLDFQISLTDIYNKVNFSDNLPEAIEKEHSER